MPVVYPLLVSESALLSYDLSSEIGEVLKVGFNSLSESQRLGVEKTVNFLAEGATAISRRRKSISVIASLAAYLETS